MLRKLEGRKNRGQQRMSCWKTSPIQWTWNWANFRRWWGTGRSGVLQSMRSLRVRHNLVTETHRHTNVYSFNFYLDCWFTEICLEAIMDYAFTCTLCKWASWVVQTVKHLSAMQETRVWSLGWEDPLEKEMAAHFSILAWKIPWTAEPGRLPSMGLQRVDMTEQLHFHFHFM